MINIKKNIYIILSFVALIAVLLPSLLVYVVDPFRIYHESIFPGLGYSDNQRMQNAGLINTYLAPNDSNYNTIILGSSMAENFHPEITSDILNVGGVLQLAMAGGLPREQLHVMKHAIDTGNLRNVVWEINSGSLVSKDADEKHKVQVFPEYLYNSSFFDDYKYVLNYDIQSIALSIIRGYWKGFSRDIVRSDRWHEANLLRVNIRGGKKGGGRTRKSEMKRYTGFESWQSPFNVYLRSTVKLEQDKRYIKKTIPTFSYPSADKNMLDVISELCNKNIEFYLYFAPVYRKHMLAGGADFILRRMGLRRYYVEKTQHCKNVRIVDLANVDWVVADLYNYKDPKHYRAEINSYIIHSFRKKINLLNEETLDKHEDELIENLYKHMDYSSIMSDCNDKKYDYSNKRMEKLEIEYLKKSRVSRKGRQSRDSLYMPRGWGTHDSNAHTSVGCNSKIYMLLGQPGPKKIKIQGEYFGKKSSTRLWINNKYIGDVNLTDLELDTEALDTHEHHLIIDMTHINAKFRKDQARKTDYILKDIHLRY